MSSDVTDAVLAQLGTVQGVKVYDAHVTDSDNNAKTISAPLPYSVLWPTPGYPTNGRMGGSPLRAQEVMVNSVGETREQAEWAGDASEAVLDGVWITVNGRLRRIARTDDDTFLRRDDTWTRPDGGPLFTDSRRYKISP